MRYNIRLLFDEMEISPRGGDRFLHVRKGVKESDFHRDTVIKGFKYTHRIYLAITF
jgi:hypothetical protein